MSEKKFAIITIATGIVWGTFFYPPPPPGRASLGAGAAPQHKLPKQSGGTAALLPGVGYQLAGNADRPFSQALKQPGRP